jgi:hypothetical protein
VNEKIKVHLARYQWQNIKLHLNNCKEYRAIYYQELIGKATNEQRQRIEVRCLNLSTDFEKFRRNWKGNWMYFI